MAAPACEVNSKRWLTRFRLNAQYLRACRGAKARTSKLCVERTRYCALLSRALPTNSTGRSDGPPPPSGFGRARGGRQFPSGSSTPEPTWPSLGRRAMSRRCRASPRAGGGGPGRSALLRALGRCADGRFHRMRWPARRRTRCAKHDRREKYPFRPLASLTTRSLARTPSATHVALNEMRLLAMGCFARRRPQPAPERVEDEI